MSRTIVFYFSQRHEPIGMMQLSNMHGFCFMLCDVWYRIDQLLSAGVSNGQVGCRIETVLHITINHLAQLQRR